MGNEILENCGEFADLFECMADMFVRDRSAIKLAVYQHVPAMLLDYEHGLLDLCDALLPAEQSA